MLYPTELRAQPGLPGGFRAQPAAHTGHLMLLLNPTCLRRETPAPKPAGPWGAPCQRDDRRLPTRAFHRVFHRVPSRVRRPPETAIFILHVNHQQNCFKNYFTDTQNRHKNAQAEIYTNAQAGGAFTFACLCRALQV